jgi:methylenetetrahydrofolate reductase (NADPH)
LAILPQLEELTKKSWWTVGSQPAVNGVSSSDATVGWGPKGGYVFQKGFVEFFCEEVDVESLEKRIEERGKGMVHYFSGNHKVGFALDANVRSIGELMYWHNRQGEFRTNVPEDARNPVTWGVFPGQEIIQTTIIEHESFLNWKVRFPLHGFNSVTWTSSVG